MISSRPAEAERGLAHVGLGDLLEDVLDGALSGLSAPRRRALEVALLREDASDDPVDSGAVAVAVRDVLQVLSERGPILIAVDDVQWLDPSSSQALAFGLRRLDASPVLLLLARRQGTQRSELERDLDAERVRKLVVGPLSMGALHRFLRDRLDRPFARQTLLRIHERSGGNPFFAIELARVLDSDIDPLQPLPVPETLEELVRARIDALPATTRQALALASAVGAPSDSLLERAGVAADALTPAFAAKVIERENGTIRFTHPLLRSLPARIDTRAFIKLELVSPRYVSGPNWLRATARSATYWVAAPVREHRRTRTCSAWICPERSSVDVTCSLQTGALHRARKSGSEGTDEGDRPVEIRFPR